jgi:hypothetical protein
VFVDKLLGRIFGSKKKWEETGEKSIRNFVNVLSTQYC